MMSDDTFIKRTFCGDTLEPCCMTQGWTLDVKTFKIRTTSYDSSFGSGSEKVEHLNHIVRPQVWLW